MQIDLSREEMDLLQRVLDRAIKDLKSEVYATEKYDWRKSLQEDEARLKSVLAKLETAAA